MTKPTVLRRSAPILVGAEPVAQLRTMISLKPGYDSFWWTWHADHANPPKMRETPRGLEPENRGCLRVAFERGPIQILEATLYGTDRQHAFSRSSWFEPIGTLNADEEATQIAHATQTLLNLRMIAISPQMRAELDSLNRWASECLGRAH